MVLMFFILLVTLYAQQLQCRAERTPGLCRTCKLEG